MGSHLGVKPSELDRNVDKIVFRNGYYDCRTGQFLDNERSQNATLCIQTEYREPDSESVKAVDEYMHGLGFDEETLQYLQRSFGYAATGRGSEKRFWWFRGETDTSKSTLIDIVAQCLDQYAMSTPSTQWCDKKATGGGHTEELARLRARRLVTADEFKKNAKFDEAQIKRITSGTGKLSASHKGEKTIEFNISFALFFSSNFDCQMAEDDTAFLNRLNTVTFEKTIAPEIKDTMFIEKFLSRGQNRMAMLKWIMEGSCKYCQQGIGTDPQHIKTSREEFLEQQISITEQLGEILEKNDKATGKKAVTLNAVLEALSQMQKATRQYSSFSKKEVSKAIETVFGVKRTSSNGHSGYSGLVLKNDFTPKKRRPYDPRIDHGYEDQDQFDDYEAPVEKSN
jgi:P4 family phage/plasmid primase-like protien